MKKRAKTWTKKCEAMEKNKRELVLVGGGGHCKSVIDAAESCGMTVRGILDMPDMVGTLVCGKPVIGTDDDMAKYVDDCDFIVTVGYVSKPDLRISLYERILALGGRLATIVASTARVSPYASIGHGTVVLHNACVNAGASIGENSIINTLANVDHDARVGSHCHISTCSCLNGNVEVGDASFVGSGTVVSHGMRIASRVAIGAACFVHHSINNPGLYLGNPLRRVRSL